jgi:microcystin-dependent protein
MTRKISHALVAIAAGAVLGTGLTSTKPAAAAEPFLGQIEYYAFNFAPRNWALCDGQILPINSYQSLYSLLGTTFGGDGRTSFGLPDMRGRIPVHDGGSAGPGLTRRKLGEKDGVETVVLTAAQVPSHPHSLRGTTSQGNEALPTGHSLADDSPDETYRNQAPNTDMHAGAIGATPSQGHENMPPFLVVNCSIALQGLFPSRN